MNTEISTNQISGSRIAETLRVEILSGALTPGQRLRQEDIAERFGASRQPVRDALRLLEGEGLVTLVANSGAWVSKLSEKECAEAYQIRERLEPLLLSASLPHLTDAKIARLTALVAEIEQSNDLESFLRLDREFHLLSYSGAAPGMLSEMVERLWNTTQHYRRAFRTVVEPASSNITNFEHRLILDAIVRKDSNQAERALEGHIRRTRIELAEHKEIFA